jgi:hypothetical protein
MARGGDSLSVRGLTADLKCVEIAALEALEEMFRVGDATLAPLSLLDSKHGGKDALTSSHSSSHSSGDGDGGEKINSGREEEEKITSKNNKRTTTTTSLPTPSSFLKKKKKRKKKSGYHVPVEKITSKIALRILHAFATVVWAESAPGTSAPRAQQLDEKVETLRKCLEISMNVLKKKRFKNIKEPPSDGGTALSCFSSSDLILGQHIDALALLGVSCGALSNILLLDDNQVGALLRGSHDYQIVFDMLEACYSAGVDSEQAKGAERMILEYVGRILSSVDDDDRSIVILNGGSSRSRDSSNTLLDSVLRVLMSDNGVDQRRSEKETLQWSVYILMRLATHHESFVAGLEDSQVLMLLQLFIHHSSIDDYVSWCLSFTCMHSLWDSREQRARFQRLEAPRMLVLALDSATWNRRCSILGCLLVLIQDNQDAFLDAGGLTPCLSLLWYGIEEDEEDVSF